MPHPLLHEAYHHGLHKGEHSDPDMFHGWSTIVIILVVIHLLAIGLVGYWAWLLNVMGQKPKRKKVLAQEHRITYGMDPRRTRTYDRSAGLDI